MLNIIHLKEREDRYAKLMYELYEQGISSYKIWDGIKHRFPFVGIKKAHQNIVREAQLQGLPFVVIAEDDIMFLGKGAYDYYIAHMPPLETFDLYLGGYMLQGELNPDNTVKDGYFTGLTLYTVSAKFYDTFLSIKETGNIDALLRGLGRYVVCDPMIVSQHGGYSNNSERIVFSYAKCLEGRNIWKGL